MRKKYSGMGILMAVALGVSGCASTNQQELGQVMLEEEEETEYSLAAATVEDLQDTVDITCVYQQVKQEELSFATSGRQVRQVYVQEGDTVEQGQLLAQLDTGTLEADICTQTYQVERNDLLIRQAQESRDAQITELKEQMKVPQGMMVQTMDQIADVENPQITEAIAGIEKSYRYQIEDYQDDRDVAQMRLEELKQEQEQCNLYAGMSGTVSFVKDKLVTSQAQEKETVMKIIDGENCTFCSEQVEYATSFSSDQAQVMTLATGGEGSYEVIPYQQENWKEQMQFTLTNSADSQSIAVGAQGKITIVLEEKLDALCVPLNAVHSAEKTGDLKQYYVYKLDENNIRQVQWVKTGVQSKDKIEITEGLEEGEKVILR